jgi:hypothetical protein
LLELLFDRGQVRIECFLQQPHLRRIELLAAGLESDPLVARQLGGCAEVPQKESENVASIAPRVAA